MLWIHKKKPHLAKLCSFKEEESKVWKKKKALKVEIQSDTECKESDEEEYTHICLMADSNLEEENLGKSSGNS